MKAGIIIWSDDEKGGFVELNTRISLEDYDELQHQFFPDIKVRP